MIDKLNYWKYRTKYKYADKLPLSKPVDVSMELSSLCNMQCAYCYHSERDVPFNVGYMPEEMAKKIIDSAADCGVHSLKFNWRGESTLNKAFTNIAKHAESLAGGSTFIDRLSNTNFKFDASRRDEIFPGLAALTLVKISYDSMIADVFENQRVGGNWQKITDNIDAFYNYPGRKTKMALQAVRTQANYNEDLEHKLKKRWPDAIISIRDVVAGRVDVDIDHLDTKKRAVERKPCLQAFCRLIFDINGNAHPCCPDIKNELILGNIEKNSVREIFNAHEALRLRKNLKNGRAFKMDPCKNCSSFESYAGYKHGWTP